MCGAENCYNRRVKNETAWAVRLNGLLLPFPTPFTTADEVDTAALQSNLARWQTIGIKGLVALGSTGERVHLSSAESRRIVTTARAATPPELVFIVGIGQHSTRATIDEAHQAAADGADAVLVSVPHFYRNAMTAEALTQHFRTVAEASPVPLLLYHIPQNTGLGFTPQTVEDLSTHENIIGLKDSSGDILHLAETARSVPPDFYILTGHGAALYAALCTGARGAILAVGCAVPEFVLRLMCAVTEGQHEKAVALQQRLTPLAQAVTTRYGIGGLKAALEIAGYAGGPVRAPLANADEKARAEIARLLTGLAED